MVPVTESRDRGDLTGSHARRRTGAGHGDHMQDDSNHTVGVDTNDRLIMFHSRLTIGVVSHNPGVCTTSNRSAYGKVNEWAGGEAATSEAA